MGFRDRIVKSWRERPRLYRPADVFAQAAAVAEEIVRAHPGLEARVDQRGGSEPVTPLDQDFNKFLKSTGLFPWVVACVEAISTYASSVPLKLYRQRKGDEPEEITDHPILDALWNPNYDDGEYSFRTQIHDQLGYTGEAYVVGIANTESRAAVPFTDLREMWVVQSDQMNPVFDKTQIAKGKASNPVRYWQYSPQAVVSGGAGSQRFAPEQVVQIKKPNPRDPIRGLSPVKKLETVLDLYYHALQWSEDFFKNQAVPGLIVTGKRSMDTTTRSRSRDQLEERHVGRGNRYKTMYLFGEEINIHRVGANPDEALLPEFFDWSLRQILAVYKVPPFAVCILEHANWSNSIEQQRFFLANAVIPQCRLVESTLSSSPFVLAHGDDLFLRHDFSQEPALQENELEAAQVDALRLQNDVTFVNEIREKRTMGDPVPWGDAQPSSSKMPAFGGFSDMEDAEREIRETDDEYWRLVRASKNGTDPKIARGRRWRAFDLRLRGIEAAWFRKLRPLFSEMRDAVLDELALHTGARAAAGNGGLMRDDPQIPAGLDFGGAFENEQLLEVWQAVFLALSERTVRTGAQDILEEITGKGVRFDVNDPRIRQYIDENVAKEVRTVLLSKRALVKDLVTKAASEGVTAGELAKRLEETFNNQSRFWSMRIARTESARLYNRGGFEGMQKAGVRKKQWLSARDADVRDSHLEAEGMGPIGIDEMFHVGEGTCMYPGETGIPAEDINCRCTHIAVLG